MYFFQKICLIFCETRGNEAYLSAAVRLEYNDRSKVAVQMRQQKIGGMQIMNYHTHAYRMDMVSALP